MHFGAVTLFRTLPVRKITKKRLLNLNEYDFIKHLKNSKILLESSFYFTLQNINPCQNPPLLSGKF